MRKSGLELGEADAMTMEQITTDQAALQKQLDQARKASKQHTNLVQVGFFRVSFLFSLIRKTSCMLNPTSKWKHLLSKLNIGYFNIS